MKGIIILIIAFIAIFVIYNSLGLNFNLKLPNVIANQLTNNLINSFDYQIVSINSYNKNGIGIIFYNNTENCVKEFIVDNVSYNFTYTVSYNEIIIYTNESILPGDDIKVEFCDGKYLETVYT